MSLSQIITPEQLATLDRVLAETNNLTTACREAVVDRATGYRYTRGPDAARRRQRVMALADGAPVQSSARTVLAPRQLEVPAYTTAGSVPISLPAPAPEAGGPSLPEPFVTTWEPFDTEIPGVWAILSDLHIPYHDNRAILKAVGEAKDRNAVGLILNGDVFDFYQLSRFHKDPSKPRLIDEIEKGRQFFEWLRSQLPRARIIFKEGNHDARARTYIADRAAALFDLPECTMPGILRLQERGIEWVDDKRMVMLGKLSVAHGHEWPGGGGVMPARWLYLRTGASALIGHFHQPSHYTFRTLDEKEISCWSTGCACYLSPNFLPANQWAHGYAICTVRQDGHFAVENRRILRDGSVV